MIALALIIGLPLGALTVWIALKAGDRAEPSLGEAYRDEATSTRIDPL